MRQIEQNPSIIHSTPPEEKTPDGPSQDSKDVGGLEDAALPVGGFSEIIQAAPNIRLANPGDAAHLARIYQEGYAGPPWHEEHDIEKKQLDFERWIEDPDFQVLVIGDKSASNSENIRGFSVTRIEPAQTKREALAAGEQDLKLPEPIACLTQSIAEEMRAVSSVDLTQAQIAHLKDNLQQLRPEQLGLDEGRPFAGIFQDIVILNSERKERGDFLNLIGTALGSLFKTRSDMLLIYTHEQVSSVVRTAEQLGGEQVLKLDNGLVIYAAPTTVVSENLKQNDFLKKFFQPKI